MCVIALKRPGVKMPSYNTLKTCWRNNPDGAGYMIMRPGSASVEGSKGYMTFDSFIAAIDRAEYNENTDWVALHFRIGTSGLNSPPNTHPFPVATYPDSPFVLHWKSRYGFMHNGILGKGTDTLTDSQLFMKETLEPMLNGVELLDLAAPLSELTKGNRLLVFDGLSSTFIATGNWVEEKNGLMYSNYTFQGFPFEVDIPEDDIRPCSVCDTIVDTVKIKNKTFFVCPQCGALYSPEGDWLYGGDDGYPDNEYWFTDTVGAYRK